MLIIFSLKKWVNMFYFSNCFQNYTCNTVSFTSCIKDTYY